MTDATHPGRPRSPAAAPRQSTSRRLVRDLIAGVVNAVVSVPDGLASAALAGVNPVYGLYTSIAAPIGGSLLTSAQLMQISTTSASALAAGQAIVGYPADQRDEALFLLVVLVGIFLALFGVLGLGRLVRFVSHAVMTGFLFGVAAVLVLDQLAPFVGVSPQGGNEVLQFVDLVAHVGQFDPLTILTGSAALLLLVGLGRTRLATVSSLIALVVPSVMVAIVGWRSVQLVADVNRIPGGLPIPALPDLALLSPPLVLAALAVAVVIGIQGAGVSQSVENPDDSPVDASRDLLAQGVGNVASGLLSGIPAGGSVGQTALNVRVGARSRWSGIFGGLWMLGIVLLVPGLVGQVPMAVLAALMIVSGIAAIDVAEARSIWNTGGAARVLITLTFVATLVLSVPLAVGVGVLLALVLYIGSSASDVRIRALVPQDRGRWMEAEPPPRLPSETVTVLDVYGSLFFAGARTLEANLPATAGATRPVVVLRLRGRTRVGATLIDVLDEYASNLARLDGRLYLSAVDDELAAQLRSAGKLDVAGTVHLVPAQAMLGDSTRSAYDAAIAWLAAGSAEPAAGDGPSGDGAVTAR